MKKHPLKSKTINGALTMAVSALAPLALAKLGVVTPEAQTEALSALGTVAGLAPTIYGRVKAKV